MMNAKLRYLLVSLVVVVAVGSFATVGYAAVTGPGGVIQGCYAKAADKRTGTHALVLTDGSCPAGYIALNWNQQGPTGPAGQPGVPGPAGPAGQPGAPGAAGGVSGYVIVHSGPHDGGDVTVICPSGKQALGGGGQILSSSGGALTRSMPVSSAEGWELSASPGFDGNSTVDAWVVCGYATP